jgi:hypothetical protein
MPSENRARELPPASRMDWLLDTGPETEISPVCWAISFR